MSLTLIRRRIISRRLCSNHVSLNILRFPRNLTFCSSFEKSEIEITVDEVPHTIKLYDTAGQEEYDQLRKTIYKHVKILFV